MSDTDAKYSERQTCAIRVDPDQCPTPAHPDIAILKDRFVEKTHPQIKSLETGASLDK